MRAGSAEPRASSLLRPARRDRLERRRPAAGPARHPDQRARVASRPRRPGSACATCAPTSRRCRGSSARCTGRARPPRSPAPRWACRADWLSPIEDRLKEISFGRLGGAHLEGSPQAPSPTLARRREADKWRLCAARRRELRDADRAGPPVWALDVTAETVVVSHGGVARGV